MYIFFKVFKADKMTIYRPAAVKGLNTLFLYYL